MLAVKTKPELQNLITKKQRERQESFAKLKQEFLLDVSARNILNLTDDELISQLQDRTLSASQVLKAYLAKALEVNEKLNCVTEFIPEAKHWAEDLDNLPEVKGPLHGIPFAVKDDTDVEGMDSTLGLAKRLYSPAKETAVIVRSLQDLGAIPFAKTNLPQSVFSTGSDNPIFGKTLNSKNEKLAPGGSSVGSGCIVGANAAVFATGTDLGGSLRIPAHFNGLSTLKCTVNRLSGKGLVGCLPKLVGIDQVPGILARNAKTTAMIYRELLKNNMQNNYDPLAVAIPWNGQVFSSKSKLRIGYFISLPFFPTVGDTSEIVLKAKSAFESLGHTTVPFQMPDDFEFIKLVNTLCSADGGERFREMLENEPDSIAAIGRGYDWGHTSQRWATLAKTALDARNSEDLWGKMHERNLLIREFLQKMDDAEVDLILSPPFPFPAVKVDDAAKFIWATVYTFVWNLVDFPAGVVQFGTESGKNIETYDDEGDALLRLAKESIRESTGMPIGVQLIARPFKEELILRAMVELERSNLKK